jgi:hypothetical protein
MFGKNVIDRRKFLFNRRDSYLCFNHLYEAQSSRDTIFFIVKNILPCLGCGRMDEWVHILRILRAARVHRCQCCLQNGREGTGFVYLISGMLSC